MLFNKSLESGIYPNAWKLAFIQPIYKKGNKNLVINYRPISILSSILKILDKIVTTKMYDVAISQIAQEQHVFVRGMLTLTNLLIYNEFIINAFAD